MKALKKGVLFTLLALVGLYGCYKVTYPTYANRFRLTMAFNIDGQTYAGSSVLELVYVSEPGISSAPYSNYVRGQAVFIDLGKHGVVIAALQNWPGPRLGSVNVSELPIRAFSTPQHEISVPEVPGLTGRGDLASDSLPRLVWLSNVTDEKSARAFAVGDLTELFGPTARLEAAFIEITSDPIVIDIDRKLPWYRDLADRQKNGIITGPHFELVYSMFVRDQS